LILQLLNDTIRMLSEKRLDIFGFIRKKMNRYGFEPDFDNLKRVLLGGRGYRVPNMELVIDQEIKDGFMGRAVATLEDEIEFRYKAGYDYAWISIGMIDPAGTVNKDLVKEQLDSERHVEGRDKRVWADEHSGRINNREDLESFSWPKPEKLDYSPFIKAQRSLRPGMKIIAVLGKIFTAAWELMGLENFSLTMYDDPEFIDDLIERIGNIQLEVLKKIVQIDTVGAVWIPDDIAYHTNTMVSEEWLKTKIFPYYKKMADICKQVDKPLIYHSDGNLTKMLDTIIKTGFDALHPIEPESMDIYEVRNKIGKKLCLVGNIRVHILATQSPEKIRELVKDRVINLGHKGAYCVGSSNSVPNYVPLENYKTMLQASADFGCIDK